MTTHTNPTDPTDGVVPGDLLARHQVITGLRALADFLADNPAVPVPEYGDSFDVFPREVDETLSAAVVDQVAELLGVLVQDDRPQGGHYIAARSFGRITYRLVHIPDRVRREFDARRSYLDNIRTDGDQDDAGQAA
ncbi:hypothetical protein [Actinomadura litoris]|uniref:Uncharacterized protein n=1 Tax=Actinomadura litoris TaxID=2678616 RepID=A0A7K1L1P3_9ACTN|nr:hypothetical protein [Actinomadura litoris]MUN38185.1 hypothetical protein [Actinomadura litoris]